jgi:F0F1-type ATP synthase assembly protein I
MKKIITIVCLLGLTACSSLHKIVTDEARQSGAMSKVTLADKKHEKAEKAKDAQIANLTQAVRILLATPPTSQTVPVADQLLDQTLSLTGAPTESESSLETEVSQLLQDKAQNEVAMAKITSENTQIKKDLATTQADKEKATQQVAKATTTLYTDALKISSDDDTKATIGHIMIGTVIFIVLMVCLRIFFTMTKTGATIAAKIP